METIKTHNTLIIVGCGLFGITTAWELLKRSSSLRRGTPSDSHSSFHIHVFDKSDIPYSDESSSYDISKVVRSDYGRDEFYMDLGNRAIEKWREWNKQFNTTLYHESGLVFLKQTEMNSGSYEMDSFEKIQSTATRLSLEKNPQNLLTTRFKAWNETGQYKDGYFNPRAGWVEASKILQIIYDQINSEFSSQITWHPKTRVQSLILNESKNQVIGIRTQNHESFFSDRTLVCCGAWTPNLLYNINSYLSPQTINSILWASGQPVIHIQLPPSLATSTLFNEHNFPVFFADISQTGWYGFPVQRNTGIMKLGHHSAGVQISLETYPQISTQFPTEFVQIGFKKFLQDSLPMLSDCKIVYQRLCLYSDTFDGDFLISKVPKVEGLIVACGGSGHAFKFGPLLGEIIADVIEEKPNKESERFKWRVPIAKKKGEEESKSIGGMVE